MELIGLGYLLPPATKLGQGYVFTGPREQTPPWEQTPPEQTPGADTPQSEHPPQSRHPPSRHPPPIEHAVRYGQCAGGMHPTGMQSCLCLKIFFLIDTNVKMWTEIIDLVVLGRNYWSSCRVLKIGGIKKWSLFWWGGGGEVITGRKHVVHMCAGVAHAQTQRNFTALTETFNWNYAFSSTINKFNYGFIWKIMYLLL